MDFTAAIKTALVPVLDALERLDLIDRINTARVINDALHDVEGEVAAVRRQSVRQLRVDGWTLAAIAAETDMTPARVMQIERGTGRAEKKRRRA